MGFFDKLVSRFTGSASVAPAPNPVPVAQPTVVVRGSITSNTSAVEVSNEEVADRAKAHAFVLSTDPPALKTADEWWNEETHKRRRREGSEKAYAWLLPFVPLDIAKLPQLHAAQEWGAHGASAVAKELRALIREKRKGKEPHLDLLRALYGTCVAADLAKSVAFEGTQPHFMVRFVDLNELQAIELDYGAMGYQCIESLSKTDVKWLVEAFGEPAEHQSFDAVWPQVRRNAVARYCWQELRRKNETSESLGWPPLSMQDWLNELVKRRIGYQKEGQERLEARQAYLAELDSMVDAAWAATRQPFVVADLETTGLNAETDEVLELGAVRVDATGTVVGEFSTLVRVSKVPPRTARLTGITQELVDRDGLQLADALKAFAEFVGPWPLFFHNAPFDRGFLKKACSQAKVKMANPVHDTLPLARQAWPSLGTFKLADLAEHVGASAPNHRALADSRATLAVLLAACAKVGELG